MEIDDSKVIRKWIMEQIGEAKKELQEDIKARVQTVKTDLNKVWSQNLLVPDLVGPGQRFENLQ